MSLNIMRRLNRKQLSKYTFITFGAYEYTFITLAVSKYTFITNLGPSKDESKQCKGRTCEIFQL